MATLPAVDRTRSPRAPKHSLRDALSFARSIYDAVHRSQIDSHTAFRLMGFAGKSGSSATALGSMRQFALIEGIGEKTRITDLALQIFEPASNSERYDALFEAANQPDIFRAIFERFEGRVPASDEALRAYLIRERGFSKTGAAESISSFRDTLAYLRDSKVAPSPGEPPVLALEISEEESSLPKELPRERENTQTELIRLPLTRECVAELRFSGRVSDRAIANLLRHIELMKEVWADE